MNERLFELFWRSLGKQINEDANQKKNQIKSRSFQIKNQNDFHPVKLDFRIRVKQKNVREKFATFSSCADCPIRHVSTKV